MNTEKPEWVYGWVTAGRTRYRALKYQGPPGHKIHEPGDVFRTARILSEDLTELRCGKKVAETFEPLDTP